MQMRLSVSDFWLKGAFFVSTCGVTIVVNPLTAYDPINLIKMLFLACGSFALLPYVLLKINVMKSMLLVSSFSLLMLLGMIVALFHSDVEKNQQLWGVWGRSTGLLTYFSLAVLLIASAIYVTQSKSAVQLLNMFQKTSYFITFYVVLQYAGLDPINWSQKLPFATLGNINFMSSLLGLATSLMISRTVFSVNSLASKAFLLTLCCLNSIIIFASGSIQGLGIILVGISITIFIKIWFYLGKLIALIFMMTITLMGLLISLGTVGYGPLGRLLIQETVLYRLDYWNAGYRMFLDNPLFGVGIDSYGDFYRMYRDLIAVERTGPGRISNTAHNVFLDVMSGSGAIAGLSFVAIYFGTSFLILRLALSKQVLNDTKHLSVLLISGAVFMMVSINQIGVAVWIFLFLGMAQGILSLYGKETDDSDNDKNRIRQKTNQAIVDISRKKDEKSLLVPLVSILSATFGIFASSPPNIEDSKFLAAYKASNVREMSSIVERSGATLFHKEKLLEYLVKNSTEEVALKNAQKLFAENPRSFFAAQVIFFSKSSSSEEKMAASRALRSLDPKNERVLEGN